MPEWLNNNTPWIWITVINLMLLSAIDWWRHSDPGYFTMVQGNAPNFVAVFILTFGFMMYRWPRKMNYSSSLVTQKTKVFGKTLLSVVVLLIAWECIQMLSDNMVFDWKDIIATVMGAVLTVLVYLKALKYSFKPVTQAKE